MRKNQPLLTSHQFRVLFILSVCHILCAIGCHQVSRGKSDSLQTLVRSPQSVVSVGIRSKEYLAEECRTNIQFRDQVTIQGLAACLGCASRMPVCDTYTHYTVKYQMTDGAEHTFDLRLAPDVSFARITDDQGLQADYRMDDKNFLPFMLSLGISTNPGVATASENSDVFR